MPAAERDDDLARLAWTWVTARGGHAMGEAVADEPPGVPDELAGRITRREPWRSVALADAALWRSVPLFYGIGLEVLVRGPAVEERFDVWERSIAPLLIEVQWARDMTGRETDGFRTSLSRLAVEDGAWRIVQVLEDGERARVEAEVRAFRAVLRQPGGLTPDHRRQKFGGGSGREP